MDMILQVRGPHNPGNPTTRHRRTSIRGEELQRHPGINYQTWEALGLLRSLHLPTRALTKIAIRVSAMSLLEGTTPSTTHVQCAPKLSGMDSQCYDWTVVAQHMLYVGPDTYNSERRGAFHTEHEDDSVKTLHILHVQRVAKK